MDFLLDFLGEVLFETAMDSASKQSSRWWKRCLAYGILFLFTLLYLFILYGSISITILSLQKREYGTVLVMGGLTVLVLVWLYSNTRKLWRSRKKDKKELL